MSIIARQSTALELPIGPVLDADGVAVTDCVVADFKLKKTTGNFAALNGSATLTHVSAGMYDLVLTTSDTDTVGLATIAIDDTVNACAPVRLQVIEEAIFDAQFAASANAFQGAAGSTKVTGVVLVDTLTTYTNNTPQTGDAYAVVNHGTHGNSAIKTETAAILDDTDLIDDGTSGLAKIATDVAAILVDTGTTLQAELDGIQADTEDIQSRLPAALVGGRIDATVDATGLEAGAAGVIADAVWEETLADHEGTVGSTAEALADAGGSGASAADIADAVWDEARSGHVASGSFGEYVLADAVRISGDSTAADNAEKYFDGTGYGDILLRTTIDSINSQTDFTLTAGSADSGAYIGCDMIIEDQSTTTQKHHTWVANYIDTRRVVVSEDPVFTIAAGDIVTILSNRAVKGTPKNRDLTIESGGFVNAYADVVAWMNEAVNALQSGRVDSYVAAAGLQADAITEIQSGLSTLDSTAVQTAAAAALADIHLDHLIASADPGGVAANSSFLSKLASKSATPAFSSYDNTTDSLEALRDNVGTAGAGLSAVPKTGYKLASDGLDLIVPADPSAIPVLGTSSIVTWIGYFGAWTVNEVNSDSDSVNLRNSADSADLATHTTSDNGSVFSSSEPA